MARTGQQQAAIIRGSGMQEFCHLGGKPAQCNPDLSAQALQMGAGRVDYVADGFEYCLDAPTWIPAGAVQAIGFQPYSD